MAALANGTTTGAVQLWDVADPARPRPLGLPLGGDSSGIYSVAFSRNSTLAAGGGSGTIQLWDLADPAHPPLARPAPGRRRHHHLIGGIQL